MIMNEASLKTVKSKSLSVPLKLSHDDLLCSFRRAPRAGAEELQYIQLVKIMKGFTLFDSKDRWRWSLEGCGEFTVASVRNLLDANSLPERYETASFASMFKDNTSKKTVHLSELRNDEYVSGADVSISWASVNEEVKNVFMEDNGKPMDGLVDDARKNEEAP
ncbi:hypothetical protein Tco_1216893 [Tanacetum coccineum]